MSLMIADLMLVLTTACGTCVLQVPKNEWDGCSKWSCTK